MRHNGNGRREREGTGNMTQEQLQLMECLRAYITDTPAKQVFLHDGQQWESLYELAAAHKMTAVVYDTLGRFPQFCREAPQLKTLWRKDTIVQIAAQTAKTRRILEITEKLNDAQIPYAVVKGIVCRQMYARQDLRPSGDEDILINGEDRQICEEIFRDLGLEFVQGAAEDEVSHWMDNGTGLHIELHRALLPEDWQMSRILNPYFTQHLASGIYVTADGRMVRTLDPTAHFVFLVVHALKHFVSGGFGIRSMGDILCFAKEYASEIDREQVREILTSIRGWTFFEQLLWIGVQYLDFDPEALGWRLSSPADFEPMLLDMLDAGIYGQTTMDRRHSAAVLVQQAKGEKKSSVTAAIFPSAESLSRRYPVLKRMPVLLPAVWIHRIGSYAAEIIAGKGRGNSPAQAVSLAKQRQSLMERYGIFPTYGRK